ncbi:MAG: nuclear transport factor 2 family protein [Actinobacteria bacterium]|nr:nuclear transport factor 2 family protein [Actinomycetota bacterium]MCB9411948.1 nuclear transport factor 2 family protein [Actinomycetota bacterium]
MEAFRQAVENRDLQGMIDCLAPDVVFTSPVAFSSYPGKLATSLILETVMGVFTDFRYVRQIDSEDGRDHALIFEAKVGDRQLTGCDFLRLDDQGLISEFMVMVRPLSGANALAAAMGERWAEIQARLAEG